MALQRLLGRRNFAQEAVHEFIGADRLRERFVGQHQAVAEHIGHQVDHVLRQNVTAAAQVGKRARTLDQVDGPARTDAEAE